MDHNNNSISVCSSLINSSSVLSHCGKGRHSNDLELQLTLQKSIGLFRLFKILLQKLLLVLSVFYQVLALTTNVMLKLYLPQRRDNDKASCIGNKQLIPEKITQSPLERNNMLLQMDTNIKIPNDTSFSFKFKSPSPNIHLCTEDNQLAQQILYLEIQVKSPQAAGIKTQIRPSTTVDYNVTDNQQTQCCTPSAQTSEIRRCILERLAQRRGKRPRRIRSCPPLCSILNQGNLHEDVTPPPDLDNIRQLFERKTWGPIIDPSAFVKISNALPMPNRKRWGPVLDLNSVFYSKKDTISLPSQVSIYKRKRWGPIIDLNGVFNVKRG